MAGLTYATERRPKVRVTIRLLHIEATGNSPKRIGYMGYPWLLMVGIVNYGSTVVRIQDASIEASRANKSPESWRVKKWGLPWVLEPGEKKTVNFSSDDFEVLTRGHTLQVCVVTSKENRFYSEPLLIGQRGSREAVMLKPKSADRLQIPRPGDPGVNVMHLIGLDEDLNMLGFGNEDDDSE